MAKRTSIFQDEWRRCLREHYKYVVSQNDKATAETFQEILIGSVGFTEDELRQLYLEATMHVDGLPEDFVPDMEWVARNAEVGKSDKTFVAHPAECTCPECMDMVIDSGHDDEGQPLLDLEDPEPAEARVFPVAKPDTAEEEDLPKQKSLF